MAENECMIMTIPVFDNNDELLNDIYEMFKQFNKIVDSKDLNSVPYLMEIITSNDAEDLVKLEAIYTIKRLLPFLDTDRRNHIEKVINFRDEQLIGAMESI